VGGPIPLLGDIADIVDAARLDAYLGAV